MGSERIFAKKRGAARVAPVPVSRRNERAFAPPSPKQEREVAPPATSARAPWSFDFTKISLYSAEENAALAKVRAAREAGAELDPESARYAALRFGSVDRARELALPRRAVARPIDVTELADQTTATGAAAPTHAAPTRRAPARPAVDRIDLITSSAGATTGYPAITSGNLNLPGPFNNPASGGVNNALQVRFHLDRGSSSSLSPRREIQRTASFAGAENKNPPDRPAAAGAAGPPTPGGFLGVIVGPDGPAAHEVLRPTADTIVVADAPGVGALAAAQYPFTYQAHFAVTVADGTGDVAQARYEVRISKTSATNVPNAENRSFSTEKRDLVRGRALP
jgi:hypothetical protein